MVDTDPSQQHSMDNTHHSVIMGRVFCVFIICIIFGCSGAVWMTMDDEARTVQYDAFKAYMISAQESLQSVQSSLNDPAETKHMPSTGGNAARSASYARLSIFNGKPPYKRVKDHRYASFIVKIGFRGALALRNAQPQSQGDILIGSIRILLMFSTCIAILHLEL